MGFTFEEKFVSNNQNFVSCYFNLKVDETFESVCLIADQIGVLYFPTILKNNVICMRPFKLLEVQTRNLVITNIYPVQHNKQSYTFVACESKDGSGYCLLTYNISNLESLDADAELISCQILENHFKIMDLKSITDENGNSLILLCGSDKRLHVYSLDTQCVIHRKKKSTFTPNQIVDKLMVASEYVDGYLVTALPLRLFLCRESANSTIMDALLGYSNGIIKWFHDAPGPTPLDSENDFIQEIPTFHGGSNKKCLSAKLNDSQKSTVPFRKNHSLGDLSSFLELNSVPDSAPSSTNKLPPGSKDVSYSTDSEAISIPPQSEPLSGAEKAEMIQQKTLLFDGIVSCLCFYEIPLPRGTGDAEQTDNRNKNFQWLDFKRKKSQYLPCIAVGLASGSSLLVCFEETEDPIIILANSLKRGGALALTLGNVSSDKTKDVVSSFSILFFFLMHFCTTNNLTINSIIYAVYWI